MSRVIQIWGMASGLFSSALFCLWLSTASLVVWVDFGSPPWWTQEAASLHARPRVPALPRTVRACWMQLVSGRSEDPRRPRCGSHTRRYTSRIAPAESAVRRRGAIRRDQAETALKRLRAGKIKATSKGSTIESALSVEARNTFPSNCPRPRDCRRESPRPARG